MVTQSGVWYAFTGYNGGKAVSLPVGPAGTYEADLYGFHGYATAAQAQANPNGVPGANILNPVSDLERQQVAGWVSNAQASASGTAAGPVVSEVPGAGAVASDTATIASFVGSLSNSGTWIRVAKVVIGGVLVIVGLAKLSGAGKVIEDVVK
jgi:hypothetical protein